ncbi:hypothetical protein TRVL_07600 [Trypanosoma vivax]|nr:hypothetical protein TRVL_07600 [Trypanosoma vivax]
MPVSVRFLPLLGPSLWYGNESSASEFPFPFFFSVPLLGCALPRRVRGSAIPVPKGFEDLKFSRPLFARRTSLLPCLCPRRALALPGIEKAVPPSLPFCPRPFSQSPFALSTFFWGA